MKEKIKERIAIFGYTLEDFTEAEIAQMEQELRDEAEGKVEGLDGILASLTYKEL